MNKRRVRTTIPLHTFTLLFHLIGIIYTSKEVKQQRLNFLDQLQHIHLMPVKWIKK